MDPEKIVAEINRLSITQRLLLAQDIWDSIARQSDSLPMPQWQKKELDKRYEHYQQGTVKTHDWRTVHDALRAQHK